MRSGVITSLISFKILSFKRKLLLLLPFGKPYKKRKNYFYKLKSLKLRSEIQQQFIQQFYGKNALGILFNTFNGMLVNSIEDVQINLRLGFDGEYNRSEIEILQRYLEPEFCVYVIGTHIGTLLIPIAKMVKNAAGFEANPSTYKYLQQNILLNRLANTKIYNYAIYNKAFKIKFIQNKANSGGSKIKPAIDNFSYHYDHPETIEVDAMQLDILQQQNNICLPDFIIMDIEGAEYAALQGAFNCLNNARFLYIEFVPDHLKNIADISLNDFIQIITRHFSKMKIMDNEISGKPEIYTGNQIFNILSEMYNNNKSADLIFLKEK